MKNKTMKELGGSYNSAKNIRKANKIVTNIELGLKGASTIGVGSLLMASGVGIPYGVGFIAGDTVLNVASTAVDNLIRKKIAGCFE